MFIISDILRINAQKTPEGIQWLNSLRSSVDEACLKWDLVLEECHSDGVTCSWIGHAKRPDGAPVTLKFGMPHMEAAEEIQGLTFWNGNSMVKILDFDQKKNSMLLERCIPGTSLKNHGFKEQCLVISDILKALWLKDDKEEFRHLSVMIDYWIEESLKKPLKANKAVNREKGIKLLKELSRRSSSDVLLATDLHAGNVLKSGTKWIAIDPKPFRGCAGYDATQHLLNWTDLLFEQPEQTIAYFCECLALEKSLVAKWLVGRLSISELDENQELGLIIEGIIETI